MSQTSRTMEWSGKNVAGRVIHPRKIGLRLQPLSLILLYEDGRKVRKRSMPLRTLKPTADPRAKADELKLRHLTHLENVPIMILTKLISIAQEVTIGTSFQEAVDKVTAKFIVDTERDLNAVSVSELKRQKDLMELSFLSNAINPTDPRFIYDKQVTFHRQKGLSAWDEEDSEISD